MSKLARSQFTEELSQAFYPELAPSGLEQALRAALAEYRNRAEIQKLITSRRASARAVLVAANGLARALKKADSQFTGDGSPQRVDRSWREIKAPLNSMLEVLEAALRPVKGRRGNPHPGRQRLRLAVFSALEAAAVPVTMSRSGAVGAVLAAVLTEADRLDGRKARARYEFNGRDWREWVVEYFEAIDAWTFVPDAPSVRIRLASLLRQRKLGS